MKIASSFLLILIATFLCSGISVGDSVAVDFSTLKCSIEADYRVVLGGYTCLHPWIVVFTDSTIGLSVLICKEKNNCIILDNKFIVPLEETPWAQSE